METVIDLIDSRKMKNECYHPLFTISGGFIEKGDRLKDYWENFNFSNLTSFIMHDLIFYIVENNIRTIDKSYALLDTGCVAMFTGRAFADLLAAIWNEMDDDSSYSYLDFV